MKEDRSGVSAGCCRPLGLRMLRDFGLENGTDSEVNALARIVITAQQGQIG